MCLTSDAVYRIRDADAIFRIERKDDQKIAQNSQLFYRKYFEITSNTSGRARGTLWRIVSKYIFVLRMVQSFYRRYFQNTTNNVTGAQEDHDRSRYAAYSVNREAAEQYFDICWIQGCDDPPCDSQGFNSRFSMPIDKIPYFQGSIFNNRNSILFKKFLYKIQHVSIAIQAYLFPCGGVASSRRLGRCIHLS